MVEFGDTKVYTNHEECNYDSPTSGSTISQLRAEYEETIRLLNDEKRELVMKNSATISDLQRMEQRSWHLEDEICRLKEELTSAHLKIQRSKIYDEKQAVFSSLPLERMGADAQGNALRLPLQRIEDNVDTLTRQPNASLFKNNMVNVARGENMQQTRALNAATEVPECRQS
jgi:molybdopterin converting factor small subunit